MIQINVDPMLQAALADLGAPAELRDANGKTLGIALPTEEFERLRNVDEEHRQMMYSYAQTLFTDEELEEDEKETETVSTEELIRHLESL